MVELLLPKAVILQRIIARMENDFTRRRIDEHVAILHELEFTRSKNGLVQTHFGTYRAIAAVHLMRFEIGKLDLVLDCSTMTIGIVPDFLLSHERYACLRIGYEHAAGTARTNSVDGYSCDSEETCQVG